MRGTHYQGGSIFSFVVVVVLAAGLLIGGAIWLRHRSDAARQATSSEMTDIASDGANTSDNSSKDDASDKQGSKSQSDGASSGSSSSSDESNSGETAGNLPHSGPAETLATLVAVSALTYAVVSFRQSRQMSQNI